MWVRLLSAVVSLLHLTDALAAPLPVPRTEKKEEGVAVYRDLVKDADVVVEAMRPGALAKLGLGYEELSRINPRIVFATLSGYGATGPYKDMPSHGIAFDTWSGIVQPVKDDQGFCRIPPNMPNVGINVGVAAPMAFFPFSGARESFFGDLHGQGRDAFEFFTQEKVVVERWPTNWSRKF